MRLIDLTYLKRVADNDNETILEMIEIFKEQCIEFKEEFQTLFDNNNYPELSLLAHKVKSSVAIMGMIDFSNELKIFEKLTKDGIEQVTYEMYVNNFISTFNKTLIEIEEIKLNLKK